MKKKLYILASVVMGLAAVSCTEKLDSVEQLGAKGSESYYANATDANAESLIASVYDSAYDTKPGMDSWTNDMISSYYQDTNADGFLGEADFSLTTLYQINYKCNLIIEKMNNASETKKRVIAEAYFFRAWAYVHLINAWQNPPLVDHVLTADELKPEHGQTADLWNYVQTSLDKAIEGLPAKSGMGGAKSLYGRVSQEAAKALKGKAYLYAGDKTNAAKWLNEVINSKKYTLVKDFSDLYSVKADFCDEYMWEWNVPDDQDSQKGSIARLNQYNIPRSEQFTMPGGIHLTGFNQGYLSSYPSKDFYDFMVARGEYGKNRMNGSIMSIDDAALMFEKFSSDEYKGTADYEGDNYLPLIAAGMTPHDAGMSLLWTGQFSNPESSQNQGYLPAKIYLHASDMFSITNANQIYSKTNVPGMRYADVLLCYAEATVDSQAGLAALNEVRTRAGLDALASYTMKDIQDERRAEFFQEGERFRDCVRWGIAKDEFKEVGKYSYTTTGIKETLTYNTAQSTVSNWTGWKDRYLVYPYASTELTQNENLNQNAGW